MQNRKGKWTCKLKAVENTYITDPRLDSVGSLPNSIYIKVYKRKVMGML